MQHLDHVFQAEGVKLPRVILWNGPLLACIRVTSIDACQADRRPQPAKEALWQLLLELHADVHRAHAPPAPQKGSNPTSGPSNRKEDNKDDDDEAEGGEDRPTRRDVRKSLQFVRQGGAVGKDVAEKTDCRRSRLPRCTLLTRKIVRLSPLNCRRPTWRGGRTTDTVVVICKIELLFVLLTGGGSCDGQLFQG